jgi:ribosomal protein RSM22 (predicted rRNA methylase)
MKVAVSIVSNRLAVHTYLRRQRHQFAFQATIKFFSRSSNYPLKSQLQHQQRSGNPINTVTSVAEQQSSATKNNIINSNNKVKSVDEEWDEFVQNLDPGSFEPHPLSSSTPSKPEPWKTILEYPARAAWRVTSSIPPPEFQYATTRMMEEAKHQKKNSRKHLRQTFEGIVKQHQQLVLRRDRERQRILRNEDNDEKYLEIDRKRDEGILPVAYGPNEVMADLYFRSFPHFVIIKRVLLEAQSLLRRTGNTGNNRSYESPQIRRVFDFGIGCGSASAAALHVFEQSIEWIHGIDPSSTMRESAKFFLQELLQHKHDLQQQKYKDANNRSNNNNSNSSDGEPIPIPQLTFSSHASTGSGESNNNSTPMASGSFDLSLLTYTAMEIPQSSAILAAAGICWEKLRPGGIFVMIEPGTPDGFSSIRTVRNMLLDCFPDDDDDHNNNEVREICHVIAPCTHNGRCPMERYQYKRYKKSNMTQSDVSETNIVDDDSSSDESDSDEVRSKSIKNHKGKIKHDDHDADDVDSDDEEDDVDGIRKGYCSFVHSIPNSGSGKGEKFSYLVVQKRLSHSFGLVNEPSNKVPLSSIHEFDDVNIPSLLQLATTAAVENDTAQIVYSNQAYLQEAIEIENRFLASDDDDLGLELVRGDQNRGTYGRIVRAPKKHRGHVLIDTCVAPGKIIRSKVMRSLSNQIPGIYNASRKSRWGGLWPTVPNLQEK